MLNIEQFLIKETSENIPKINDRSYSQEHNFSLTMNLKWGLGQSCVKCPTKLNLKKVQAPYRDLKSKHGYPTTIDEQSIKNLP